MKINKRILPTIYFTLIFTILIIFFKIKGNNYKNEILQNKYETVGEVFMLNHGAKRSVSLSYKYYYKGKMFISNYPTTKSLYKDYFNKKFKVLCDSLNPDNSIIFLNIEITDNTDIDKPR